MEKSRIQETIVLPITDNKVFRQWDEYSCGPRALQTALAFFDIIPDFPKVKYRCKTDRDGTDVDDIAKAASYFGLTAIEEDGNVKKLKKYLDNGYLVLIMWYTGTVSRSRTAHSVVVYAYDDKYLFSWDPDSNLCAVPVTILSQRELQRSWRHDGEEFSWMLALRKENDSGKNKEKIRCSKTSRRRVVPRM